MRWILRTSENGEQGRTIASARTLREAVETGRRWLEKHPHDQRCYATDSRRARTVPVTRTRAARSRHTFKEGQGN
jgi:hypothetical protein